MEVRSIEEALSKTDYPGRGIIAGLSKDGQSAVAAYWIMGRSENSRNRIFVEDGESIRTEAFDETKLKDPHLIIYSPVRMLGSETIVTNGDQTDTIYDELKNGGSFYSAVMKRMFEDDNPNFTPRISALLSIDEGKYRYSMSIIKSDRGDPSCVERFVFDYDSPRAGTARYIHTYEKNGDPLPSFEGEPEVLYLPDSIDEVTDAVWGSLNYENKISLYVRFINIKTGAFKSRMLNKNKRT